MIQIDSLEIEIKTSSEKATSKVDRLKSSLDGLRSTIRQTSAGIATVRAPRGLERVAAQLENQRKILGKLKAEYRATVDTLGADSAKSLGLEKKIYAAQDAMDRLNSKKYKMEYGYADELAAGIDKAVLKFNQLAEARERAAALGRSTVSIDYDIGHQAERIQRLNAEFAEVTGRAHEAAAPIQEAAQRIRETGAAADVASKSTKKLSDRLGYTIKRILLYRVVRGLLTGITNGLEEGLKTIYAYSKAVGTPLSGAMDSLKTDVTYLRHSVVASLAPLIQTLAPVFNFIVNGLTRIINLITMLFAALSGKSTYTQAIRGAVEYSEATGAAAGAAQELKRQLMGFDELNVLNDNSAGGGGGGNTPDPGTFFEESPVSGWFADFAFRVRDILFNWDDLTPENIAQKIITGLGVLLGGVTGFLIGGVPGAIIGSIAGLVLGLGISSVIFNGDGVISKGEITDTLYTALNAVVGGVIGGLLFGPIGAAVGATLGLALTLLIDSLDFGGKKANQGNYDSKASWFLCDVIGLPTDQEIMGWFDTLRLNVSKKIDEFLETGRGIVQGFRDGLSEKWDELKSWWDGLKLNGFQIRLPRLELLWDSVDNVVARFFGVTAIPRLNLSWVEAYAAGGFPTAGQLFLANEAGPELVGSMGGHTAVANNDQIVEGIEQGVYRAVMAAMSNSNGNGQRIELFVDGKKMADTVTRYQRQSAKAYG